MNKDLEAFRRDLKKRIVGEQVVKVQFSQEQKKLTLHFWNSGKLVCDSERQGISMKGFPDQSFVKPIEDDEDE